jgi:DNA-binding GntR family transcriptional regulator
MEAIKPKKSLVQETYEILLDAICTREFLPGERLNQDEIAARLNVSRQPVNSALAILRADNLVEDTGRRGVVVCALDPVLFNSISEYRLTVEPFAVQLAAERLPDNAAEQARDVLDRGRAAVEARDMRALLRTDNQFHEMIYGWTRNQVLVSSMTSNWNHIRRAMAEVLSKPAKAGAVWDEHEGIIAALLGGDVEVAQDRMRDHIRTAYDRNFSPVFGSPDEKDSE